MMTASSIIGNPDSKLFPNQTIDGRDQELYPKIEPDVPRKYHEKLKDRDMQHLYPELFDEDGNRIEKPTDEEETEKPDTDDPKVEPDPEPEPDDPKGDTEEPFEFKILTTLKETVLRADPFSRTFETNCPVGEESKIKWDMNGNMPSGLVLGGGILSASKFEESGQFKFTVEAEYKDQKAVQNCVLDIVDDIL